MHWIQRYRSRALSLTTLCVCVATNASAQTPPPILKAEPLPTAQERDLFPLNGGRSPQHVVAADGGHSVDLGDGRVLWLFGDTVVGYSPDKADIIRFKEQLANPQVGRTNTAAIMKVPEKGSPLVLRYWAPLKGLKDGEPIADQAVPFAKGESFAAGDRLWPMGGTSIGEWIYVFMLRMNQKKSDDSSRYVMARSPVSDPLRFERVMDSSGQPLVLPFQESVDGTIAVGPLELGRTPWVDQGYLYCYATYTVRRKQWRGLPNEKTISLGWAAHLARVPVEKLNVPDAWELAYGRGQWGKVRESAASFFELQGHGVSVHKNRYLGKWVAAYAPLAAPGVNNSLEVVVRVADEPGGPWSNAVEIFRAPVAPQPKHTPLFGSGSDSNMYIAELHPWSSPDDGRTILLTFNDARRGEVYATWVDLARLGVSPRITEEGSRGADKVPGTGRLGSH